MKKSTKGAAAAATAGVLLLGGAGSLAFWTDSITVGGDDINSGHLSLDDTTGGTPGNCSTAPWTLDGAEDPANAVFDPATDEIVPGDTLTKVCTFDVNAIGTHLRANLSTLGGAASGDLATPVTVSSVYTVGSNSVTSITDDNDGDELEATITLTFPLGATGDNTSQDQSLTISDYTVTATQVHNVAP